MTVDSVMLTARRLECFLSSMTVLLIAAVVLTLRVLGSAAVAERLIDVKRSTVTIRVFIDGPLPGFADDHVVIQAPLLEGSLGVPAAPHLQLSMDARKMRVVGAGLSAKERLEIQTRTLGPDVLDVKESPFISYHSLAIEPLGANRWIVRGELGLHRHVRPHDVTVLRQSNRYKGSTTFRQSDFGIEPTSIAGGTARVKDEITVDFDIVTEG
jgi:hypothetical protein